jgi:hypothetical protein
MMSYVWRTILYVGKNLDEAGQAFLSFEACRQHDPVNNASHCGRRCQGSQTSSSSNVHRGRCATVGSSGHGHMNSSRWTRSHEQQQGDRDADSAGWAQLGREAGTHRARLLLSCSDCAMSVEIMHIQAQGGKHSFWRGMCCHSSPIDHRFNAAKIERSQEAER